MKRGIATALSLLAATALVTGCATTPQAQKTSGEPAPIGPKYRAALPQTPSATFGALVYHVTYAFAVGPKGQVLDAKIVDSESPPRIILASHQALMGSSFTPCQSTTKRTCKREYTYRFIIPKVQIRSHGP
jgi:hypothetical protein